MKKILENAITEGKVIDFVFKEQSVRSGSRLERGRIIAVDELGVVIDGKPYCRVIPWTSIQEIYV